MSDSKKSKSKLVSRSLCEAFIAANIPFYKLNHPVLRKVLEENVAIKLVDEKTLRTDVLCNVYEHVMSKLREDLSGPLYIIVDETSDPKNGGKPADGTVR